MSYFDPDFLEFFSELDQDNNKKWFDKNRKRYLKTIKEPFYEFIQELIIRLQQEDSELFTEPKESIFRVNRDLRFTKDKTPYKLHVSASMSTGGRKVVTGDRFLSMTLNHVPTAPTLLFRLRYSTCISKRFAWEMSSSSIRAI